MILNVVDFVQKNEKLFDDVMYLCRSLDFHATKSKQTSVVQE
jgi:hypothetical protein